jgi:K+-sensing histidine kinase KdpD
VLGIDPGPDGQALTQPAQGNLLQGFANLAALAIERASLAEQASKAEVLKNTERLQTAI